VSSFLKFWKHVFLSLENLAKNIQIDYMSGTYAKNFALKYHVSWELKRQIYSKNVFWSYKLSEFCLLTGDFLLRWIGSHIWGHLNNPNYLKKSKYQKKLSPSSYYTAPAAARMHCARRRPGLPNALTCPCRPAPARPQCVVRLHCAAPPPARPPGPLRQANSSLRPAF
jgi:hypothetical protein